MAKMANLEAIRDWCKLMFQPTGNYAERSDIPTMTSQLVNDTGYVSKNVDDLSNYHTKSATYKKNEVDEKIGQINRDLQKNTTSIRNIDKQLDSGRVAFKWNDSEGLEVRIDGTYVGKVTLG